jgi:hypothetical protein
MSNRNRFISQIAGIIHDKAHYSYGYISINEAIEDIRRVNDGHGFTLDLRDPGQGENQWSRYEGVSLNGEEMEKAIEMARAWSEKYS